MKKIMLLINKKGKYKISKESNANKITDINIYKSKDGYEIKSNWLYQQDHQKI